MNPVFTIESLLHFVRVFLHRQCAVDCQSAGAFPMNLLRNNRRLTVYGTSCDRAPALQEKSSRAL